MVTNISILTLKGLRDWLQQRVTAVILGLYTIFIVAFIVSHSQMGFFEWQDLFNNNWMRIASLLALASIILHAWIGLWTVSTDYLKPIWLRLVFQVTIALVLLGLLFWGIEILWGIV